MDPRARDALDDALRALQHVRDRAGAQDRRCWEEELALLHGMQVAADHLVEALRRQIAMLHDLDG